MLDDQYAYEHLIRPMEDRMMRAVWGVTQNPDDAEEALQDALAVIWRRWDRIVDHPNPQALVLRICMNAAYDVLRCNTRRRRHEVTSDRTDYRAAREHAAIPSPSEALDRSEQESAILQAIARLSRNQAVAVFMRLVQGQTYEDIARVLGCGDATARKHLERGRERLRALLAPLAPRLHKETSLENARQI